MKRLLDFIVGVPLVWLFGFFSKSGNPAAPRRLLVIKLAAAGDTILLIPVFKSLRNKYPAAQIHWLVSSINLEIARTVPYVQQIVLFPGFRPMKLFKLVQELKGQQYDTIVDFEQWARGTALISYFIGAPNRLGFDTPGERRSRVYTHSVRKGFNDHEIHEFFNLLRPLGVRPDAPDLELWETEEGIRELDQWKLFREPKKKGECWIIIHPGCGSDGRAREWPIENYAVLAHWMAKKLNARIFLTGGPEEVSKTRRLLKLINGEAMDLGGRLRWMGTVSLVKRADLVVSGNTGIMHVAAALKRPQIALHGPTNPALWGPLNPNAVVIQSSCPKCPCLRLGFEYHSYDQSCMKRIDIDEVKSAAVRLFDNPGQI